MENKATRIGKRIMAVMLSLVMAAGIFAGMKLDVRAAETRKINLYDYLKDKSEAWIYYDNITYEDKIIFKSPTYEVRLDGIRLPDGTCQPGGIILPDGIPCIFTDILEKGKFYKLSVKITVNENQTTYKAYLYFDENKQQEIASASEEKADISHTCNFEWITTIDPTTGADGLEQYKCAGCGLIKESHPIPASVAAVKDFYGNIKDAPENGSITYDSGKLYTISDYLLKKMSERSDISVTVNFEYQNAKYELTFPAGTDFTSVLTDEDTMYGYFGVAAKLGLTVVAK